MTSQRRKRQASGDISDDSALESDVSSLTDGDTGSEGSVGSDDRCCPPTPPPSAGRRQRDSARPPRPRVGAGSRVTSSFRAAAASSARDRRRDRMLMRDWLQQQADRRSIPNMDWCNRERTMIRIPWKHGSRSGWTIEDCQLYRAWAQYTGKCSNNVDEPKRWKANFRCALNSLPDVREVKTLGQNRGKEPFKVYEFLDVDAPRKGGMKKRRRYRRNRPASLDMDYQLLTTSCLSRLPSYVEQETAPPTPNSLSDDEQFELLEEETATVVDRTSTEPLQTTMAELLSMTVERQATVSNGTLNQSTAPGAGITCCMNRMIPTCVTELGETLMNEVDLQDDPESEILTAVSSLDSDCWSASSCAESCDFTDLHSPPIFDDTSIFIGQDSMIPSWSQTDDNYILAADESTSDYIALKFFPFM